MAVSAAGAFVWCRGVSSEVPSITAIPKRQLEDNAYVLRGDLLVGSGSVQAGEVCAAGSHNDLRDAAGLVQRATVRLGGEPFVGVRVPADDEIDAVAVHRFNQRARSWRLLPAVAPPRLVHEHDGAGGGCPGGLQVSLQPSVLWRVRTTAVATWQLVTVDVQGDHMPSAQVEAVVPAAVRRAVRILGGSPGPEVRKVALRSRAAVFMVAWYGVGDVLETPPGRIVGLLELGQRAGLILQVSQCEDSVRLDLLDQVGRGFVVAIARHPAATVVVRAVRVARDVSRCGDCLRSAGAAGPHCTVGSFCSGEADRHADRQ